MDQKLCYRLGLQRLYTDLFLETFSLMRQKYNYTDIRVHGTVTNKQEGPSLIKA